MKTTKLFTTLAAFALVLGLGACDLTEDEETPTTSSDTSEPTGGDKGETEETSELTNYTVAFNFVDSDEEATSIPDYATAYIIGSWDSWGAFLPLTLDDGVYSYTFASIEAGTYEYKGVMWYTGEEVSWTNCVEIITEGTGNATLVVSEEEGDNYTQTIQVTLTETLEERGEPVVTYVITIGSLPAAPDGIVLYAAGNFNGTWNESGWYEWGDPVALTNNGDATYNLVLYELPVLNEHTEALSFEVLADDTTDETQDMWNYILGSHTFTADDVNVEEGATKSITIETSYTSWYEDGGVFPPLGEEEEDFYVAFINGNTGDFTSYDMTFTADIACWEGGSCTASHTQISDNHYAFYSSVASYYSGAVTNFELSANGHSFKTTAGVTIPSNESGTPIYIGICWVDNWQADTSSTTWDVDVTISAAGWQFIPSTQTVESFLNSYTVSAYWDN